jgi:hypothetical protein
MVATQLRTAFDLDWPSLEREYSQQSRQESFLKFLIENDHLQLEAYMHWAREIYQFPSISEHFFFTEIDSSLCQHVTGPWTQEIYPVYQWEDLVYIVCLEPPAKTASNWRVILATPQGLKLGWQQILARPAPRLQSEVSIRTIVNLDSDVVGTAAPATPPPSVKNIDSKIGRTVAPAVSPSTPAPSAPSAATAISSAAATAPTPKIPDAAPTRNPSVRGDTPPNSVKPSVSVSASATDSASTSLLSSSSSPTPPSSLSSSLSSSSNSPSPLPALSTGEFVLQDVDSAVGIEADGGESNSEEAEGGSGDLEIPAGLVVDTAIVSMRNVEDTTQATNALDFSQLFKRQKNAEAHAEAEAERLTRSGIIENALLSELQTEADKPQPLPNSIPLMHGSQEAPLPAPSEDLDEKTAVILMGAKPQIELMEEESSAVGVEFPPVPEDSVKTSLNAPKTIKTNPPSKGGSPIIVKAVPIGSNPTPLNTVRGFPMTKTSQAPLEICWIENRPRFETLLKGVFTEMQNHFLKSIIFKIENNQAVPWKWDENFVQGPEVGITLAEPSIFKIVSKTKKPYHGYVVANPVNTQFFNDWNHKKLPEHVTMSPLVYKNSLIGMLMGFGTAQIKSKPSLQLADKLANQISGMVHSQLSKRAG